jgi:hypothetical protein
MRLLCSTGILPVSLTGVSPVVVFVSSVSSLANNNNNVNSKDTAGTAVRLMAKMPMILMAKMAMLRVGKREHPCSTVSMIIQIVVMIGIRYP